MGSECTSRFTVEWKLSDGTIWQSTLDQYDTPIVIPNLPASTAIDYRITRYCCNGVASTPAIGTFTTPA